MEKTSSVIEIRSFFLGTTRVEWQPRPLHKKSFVEVAVTPINGHTSSPHHMHVINDEK